MRYQYAAFADEADSSIINQIAAMKRNGISLLEIRGVDGSSIADISVQKAREVRKMLEAEGLAVWSLGSPYGKTNINEAFAPALEQFKRGLELAQELGAGHIRMFSFYVPEGKADEYFDQVIDRLEQFSLAAKGSGVLLCHENEKGIFGDVATRCLKIHQALPELKAVFDPANFIQCGQDTLAAWELLAPYVEYMHIKDAKADGFVVPAGHGIGNIPKLLEQYKGSVLTVEPHLTVFQGMEQLEQEKRSQVGSYVYRSSGEAFDAAVNALKQLIKGE